MQFQETFMIFTTLFHLVLISNAVKQILPEKFEVRGLSLEGIGIKNIEQRRSEFERDWERRLNYLVINKGLNFEKAWECVLQLLDEIKNNP